MSMRTLNLVFSYQVQVFLQNFIEKCSSQNDNLARSYKLHLQYMIYDYPVP
jgi:hypothetical protein